MRIVLVGAGRLPIPPPGYGGMERYIAEYAAALQRAGQAVRILNQFRPGTYTRGSAFERHLPGLLRGHDEEIVHVNTSLSGVMLALAGIPYVYTSHHPGWFTLRTAAERLRFEDERFAVRFARASVAFTGRLEERMRRLRFRRGPVTQIPLGVDSSKFRARGPGDPRLALSVGEVTPRKRWHLALEALASTGIRFMLVGPIRDPDYAERLRSRGAELRGEVTEPDLLAAYEACGQLLHPSSGEALPGAVLQAMAFSRPVLGGPAIAPIEGVLAASTDEETELVRFFREQATRFRDDDAARRSAGALGRASVEANYAWERVVERHLALYDWVRRRDRR